MRTYLAADQQAVLDLWDRCDLLRPWNNPVKDIARKLESQFGLVSGSGYPKQSGGLDYDRLRWSSWLRSTIWRLIQVCAGKGLDAD